MAQVTMDINELKALENEVDVLKKEKEELIEKQRMVVILHKHFDAKMKLGSKKLFEQNKVDIHAVMWSDNYTYPRTSPHSSQARYMDDRHISMQQLLDKGLIEIEVTPDETRTTKDYVNLSDVVAQITAEQKEVVALQLQEALKRASDAEYQITVVEDKANKRCLAFEDKMETDYRGAIQKLEKQIDSDREGHAKAIELLQKSHADTIEQMQEKEKAEYDAMGEKYEKLQQEFEDFKANKKRLTLEQQIDNMQEIIMAWKNRGFWARMFNISPKKKD